MESKRSNGIIPIIRSINAVAYGRILPALVWLFLAYPIYLQLFNDQHLIYTINTIVKLSFYILVISLFLVRRPVAGKRASIMGALVAIAGTFSPFLLGFVQPSDNLIFVYVGVVITIIGMIFSMVSLATLGRCFGLFPEVRGLVTHGPYRLIRHPLYLGELVATLGIAVTSFSVLSFFLWIGIACLQIWRTKNEEEALTRVFPDYTKYQKQTWRLVPFVW